MSAKATSGAIANGVKRKGYSTQQGASKRIKQFASAFGTVITVLVGESSKTAFSMHQDLICQRSSFLDAACSKQWKEGEDKVVPLPDSSAEILRMYLERIYNSSGQLSDIVSRFAEKMNEELDISKIERDTDASNQGTVRLGLEGSDSDDSDAEEEEPREDNYDSEDSGSDRSDSEDADSSSTSKVKLGPQNDALEYHTSPGFFAIRL